MSFKESIEYNLNHSDFGNLLQSRFEILEEIYRSSLSYIYKIQSKDTGKFFVLKAIRRQEDFEFNIEIAKKINHKNIVKLEEYGYSDQFLFIIREYIEGVNLEHFIKNRGPFSKKEVNHILVHISSALNYLHNFEEGAIIFRDLKPSNIMITPSGNPILIDIITIRALSNEKQTDTFYIGSKGYAAPEQYGYMQSNEKSDVFSLGATLYYMVTGKHPEQLDKEAIGQLSVNKSIKRTLLKATQFNPSRRHGSIKGFMADLKRPFDYVKLSAFSIGMLLMIFAFWTYQNRPLAYDIETIKSSENIHLEDMLVLEDGLEFSFEEQGQLLVHIEREKLDESIKDFEFLSVGLAYASYDKHSIKDAIFVGLKDKIGFAAYPNTGYSFAIEDQDNLCLVLYSSEREPLAYYLYSDFENPYFLEPGVVEIDRLSESLTIHYYEDHMRVSIDQDIEVPFTKIAVYSNPVGFDSDNKEVIRENCRSGLNVREYMMPGFDSRYGQYGIRDRLSWMIVLMDDDYNIVKEYIHYDDFVSEEKTKSEEIIVEATRENVLVSETVSIDFQPSHMTVFVDQAKEIPFTRISTWSNPRAFSEDEKDWIRSEGITEDNANIYREEGQVNGYGPDGMRDGLSWFIVLLDDSLNIVKEYEYYDDYISRPLEIDEIVEGMSIYYYETCLRVVIDEQFKIPFEQLSVWSHPSVFSEEDKKWILDEGINESNARTYQAGGHVSGYGSENIRAGQEWMIVLLDKNLEALATYFHKDDYVDENPLLGVYHVTDGIDVNYYKRSAEIKMNPDLLPEYTRFSIWGSGSGLSDSVWASTRLKVSQGQGIQAFNEEGYKTGYGNIASFTGQDWMIFLLDDDNNIIKEYGIDF